MNEHIKKLAEQAYGSASTDHFKFAELIAQDCITQIAMLGISNFDNEDIMWAVERSIEGIQQRYGIK
jgi:hypothetical protein